MRKDFHYQWSVWAMIQLFTVILQDLIVPGLKWSQKFVRQRTEHPVVCGVWHNPDQGLQSLSLCYRESHVFWSKGKEFSPSGLQVQSCLTDSTWRNTNRQTHQSTINLCCVVRPSLCGAVRIGILLTHTSKAAKGLVL